MYDAKASPAELNAALTLLGIAPTDEAREKMRGLLDRVWRAGYSAGDPSIRCESPYREE